MTSMVITVSSEDEIYLNKQIYTLEGLKTALAAVSDEERANISAVVIEGDKNVSYDLLVEVLDILRINSFKGVNLRMKDVSAAND